MNPVFETDAPPVALSGEDNIIHLQREILALPRSTRALLASRLIESLDQPESVQQQEIDRAWAEEIDRRVQSVLNGTAKTVDGKTALKSLRNR